MSTSIRPRFASLLATISIAAALAAVPASASATIQLGAYTPGAPANAQALSDYAAMVGRKPDIVMWYRDFGQPLLYSNEVSNLRATGQTPMATWEPYSQTLSQIASGAYDTYLHESAQIAKTWGSTMMIRFGHEMNGTWYPWAGGNASPETFVAAWRHIVSVFRADGANNVKWVWSPNIQEGSKYPIAPYFPGDAWIDFVALDGYNWGQAPGESWRSLQSVFAPSYSIVTGLSSKPVVFTETSSSERGGDKAAWIRQGFLSTIPQSFPRVSAVVWFNRSQEDDWRINSSQTSLSAYRAVVACSIYGGTGPCETGATGTTGTIGTTGTTGAKGAKHKKRLAFRSLYVPQRVRSRLNGAISYGLSRTAWVKIKILSRGHYSRRVILIRRSHAGHNRLPLARILRRRRLHVGKYRVVISAHNGLGQRSRSRKDRFRVV